MLLMLLLKETYRFSPWTDVHPVLWDTANIYEDNEALLGAWFHAHPTARSEKSPTIATLTAA